MLCISEVRSKRLALPGKSADCESDSIGENHEPFRTACSAPVLSEKMTTSLPRIISANVDMPVATRGRTISKSAIGEPAKRNRQDF